MIRSRQSLPWKLIVPIVGMFVCVLTLSWYLLKLDPMFGFGTLYAPGYSESRFATLKRGMTESEVEQIMGPPLSKGNFFDQGTVWMYSRQPNPTSNFFRRWVIFKDGKSDLVINDYWWD